MSSARSLLMFFSGNVTRMSGSCAGEDDADAWDDGEDGREEEDEDEEEYPAAVGSTSKDERSDGGGGGGDDDSSIPSRSCFMLALITCASPVAKQTCAAKGFLPRS
jgi:hypothetical protein